MGKTTSGNALNSSAYSNRDGFNPFADLILSGNTLYGTAQSGGDWGKGSVFALRTDGTGFTTMHSFTTISDPYYTNDDGAAPWGGLILWGNTLYGTASVGGGSANGVVFRLSAHPAHFR